MEWSNLIDRDLYCTKNERVTECIAKAYDYGLLHIPLVDNKELLGLIDFYRLAGIISNYKDNFSKISCKDIIRGTIAKTRIHREENMKSIIRRMVLGNYTSIGVSNDARLYEGTVTAKSLAYQLIHRYLDSEYVGEIASSRVGIIGPDMDLYQILLIISRRRQPCVVVFNGYDVEGIVCLDDIIYMLSQFEGSLPLYESTSRDVIKTPRVIDSKRKISEELNIIDRPLLVSENGEIAGLLSVEDVLVYARKKLLGP